MAMRKVGMDAWAEYLALFTQLSEKLSDKPWFREDWQTVVDYLNRENPSGVWFQLIKKHWFDGAIHIETAINNSALQRNTLSLVLHIETSKERHGLSRNDFSRLFLERCGSQIESWPGYSLKPNYAMEPFNVQLAFTGDTLVPIFERELERLQQLGSAIDKTIQDVRK